MNYCRTLIILLLLCAVPLSADYLMQNDHGKRAHIKTITINGTEYTDAYRLHKSISHICGDEIFLHTWPACIFLRIESFDIDMITQMNKPAILYRKATYFPLMEVLRIADSVGIFKSEFRGRKIKIKYLKEQGDMLELAGEKIKSVKQWQKKTTATKKEISSPRSDLFRGAFYMPRPSIQNGLESIHNMENNKAPFIMEYEGEPEDATQEEVKPVPAPKPVVQRRNYPPNMYVVPSSLIRKELKKKAQIDSLDPIGSLEIDEIHEGPLFASDAMYCMLAPVDIEKVTYKAEGAKLSIRFTATSQIKNYQRPEIKNGQMIIRFPGAINTCENFDNTIPHGFAKSAETEIIREFLLYKYTFYEEVESMSCRRINSTTIEYTATLAKAPNLVGHIDNSVPSQSEASEGSGPAQATELVENSEVDNTEVENLPTIDNSSNKGKWALDVIVLDPGHGGEDAGAVGVAGTKEKDITLKIARELQKLINKGMPGTKVVLTRDKDVFIPLHKRGKIANQNGGKLFISIHCNAARRKPHKANGFETFILRPGKTDDAIAVANLENSAIKFEKDKGNNYRKLTEEELIVATMAQSAFVKFSELFARKVQDEIGEETGLANRGIKQAGFYVLIGASMPNVLFESAFLSNRSDEKYIRSERGIEETARGLYKAIVKYANEYNKITSGM